MHGRSQDFFWGGTLFENVEKDFKENCENPLFQLIFQKIEQNALNFPSLDEKCKVLGSSGKIL